MTRACSAPAPTVDARVLAATKAVASGDADSRSGRYTLHGMGSADPTHWLVTDEPHRFGSGWISGTIGAVFGLAAAGTAACLLFPSLLTTPELRPWYPLRAVRPAIHAAMLVAFVLGMLSLCLRRKKVLGAVAVSGSMIAALLLACGPATLDEPAALPTLGLDVLVLSLLAYTAVFVPLERLWPQRPHQPTFRREWWTDLAWFAANALLVQLTTALAFGPARLLRNAVIPALQDTVRTLPLPVQLVLAIVVADFVQYWIHRACHRIPLLWRFHAIHHSATAMDWLAGSRLHLIDAVLTRSMVYVPLFLLGFDSSVLAGYVILVAVQATFVHANLGWRLGWLERWLATPRFHHWHHAEAPIDVNFAVHLPWLDRLFGTHHLPPTAWPDRYGLGDGAAAPRGFWRQLTEPLLP